MAELNKCPEAAAVLAPLQKKAAEAYGDVAKNIQLPENILRMMEKMTVEDSLKQMGGLITPDILQEINHSLNKIPKQ